MESWKDLAACFNMGTDMFMDEDEGAYAVCALCKVRRECLAYALDTDAQGVWGGTSQTERQGASVEASPHPAQTLLGGEISVEWVDLPPPKRQASHRYEPLPDRHSASDDT